MEYLLPQAPGVVTSSTNVTVTVPQVSLAVTVVMSGAGTALAHWTVTATGQVRVGAVMSWTVMLWLTVPDGLPQASTAFQVLVCTEVPAQAPGAVTSLTSTIVCLLYTSDAADE